MIFNSLIKCSNEHSGKSRYLTKFQHFHLPSANTILLVSKSSDIKVYALLSQHRDFHKFSPNIIANLKFQMSQIMIKGIE